MFGETKKQIFWCKKNIHVKKFGVKKRKSFGVKNATILVYKNWCTKLV